MVSENKFVHSYEYPNFHNYKCRRIMGFPDNLLKLRCKKNGYNDIFGEEFGYYHGNKPNSEHTQLRNVLSMKTQIVQKVQKE